MLFGKKQEKQCAEVNFFNCRDNIISSNSRDKCLPKVEHICTKTLRFLFSLCKLKACHDFHEPNAFFLNKGTTQSTEYIQ